MPSNRMKCRPLPLFVSLFVAALLTVPAAADQLVVQGLGPQKVTVTGFAGGKLLYQTTAGNGEREYDRVAQLTVDGEPALNAAEAARSGGQSDGGLDDYVKALKTTGRPWVKAYAARRVFDVAGTKYEPKVAAYLALLAVAPEDAEGRRPALPNAGSRLLDVTAAAVESTLTTPKLSDKSKTALLAYLADVHRARGDDAAVVATVERLAKASPAAANDPAVQSQLAGLKVTQAKAAVEKKDYRQAVALIESAKPAINDPAQQADALFVLAQAKLANADAADKAAQQDAALAFMRVVAHANALPGRPNVLASLRATAGILERSGVPADAAKVYRQIARDFPDDPAAVSEAKAAAERLDRSIK